MNTNRAAALTAAALIQIFPKVTLLDRREERFGFSVTATVPGGISKEAFPLIEERVMALRTLPVRKMEMMGANAAELLRHHHQMERAEQALAHGKELVQVVQIGNFVDLGSADGEFEGYRLLELECQGDEVCLKGTSHASAEETKFFVRQYKNFKLQDHEQQVEIVDGQVCWTPELEEKRFELMCMWRNWVHENGGVIFEGPKVPRGVWSVQVVQHEGAGRNGLLDCEVMTGGQLHKAPKGISKIFFMGLGLPVEENGDELTVKDIYGTPWCVAQADACPVSFERLLGLMLEICREKMS